ncbi:MULTISPECIES: ImmA/IrrE family metallo-endopeptidase [Caproicibacterium]|uniref:ImmA/IrrE family metallo-endopeptidase n=1 Tax=Caproicibacterium argilliputei TaxID=3030016 RepID=A0AA97DCL9_9FIRM|nr:ImmA/IrrE family metallo-endopeptidase [Caproicibacterium argilliputei]WOC33021.1 ImmA/IrrE family metallo-endopeptidase [Caproicibacterium argilliputei]
MIDFSDLYEELTAQQIAFYQFDVGEQKSATIEMRGRYAVFIDMASFPTLAESKRAIAHEIGHCATGCTHQVCSPLDLIEKHEFEANKWATERFLPYDEICTALAEGHIEPWQLAEYFGISEKAIRWALRYYIENRGLRFNVAS